MNSRPGDHIRLKSMFPENTYAYTKAHYAPALACIHKYEHKLSSERTSDKSWLHGWSTGQLEIYTSLLTSPVIRFRETGALILEHITKRVCLLFL